MAVDDSPIDAGQTIRIPVHRAYGDLAGTIGVLAAIRHVIDGDLTGWVATVTTPGGRGCEVWVQSCWGCGTATGTRWAAEEGVDAPHTYCVDCAVTAGQPLRPWYPGRFADPDWVLGQPVPIPARRER